MDAPARCPTCGLAWLKRTGTLRTLVGYGAPTDGHDHDDNCLTRAYACSGACPTFSFTLRRRCPKKGCAWVGEERCFQHGTKVDAWPTPDVPVIRGFL